PLGAGHLDVVHARGQAGQADRLAVPGGGRAGNELAGGVGEEQVQVALRLLEHQVQRVAGCPGGDGLEAEPVHVAGRVDRQVRPLPVPVDRAEVVGGGRGVVGFGQVGAVAADGDVVVRVDRAVGPEHLDVVRAGRPAGEADPLVVVRPGGAVELVTAGVVE